MVDFDPDTLKRDANGNVLRSELLRINKPVLRKLSPRQRRTIVRWLRGPKYWNAWAEKMLARRKELEEKGEWRAKKNSPYGEIGLSQSAHEWIVEAEVNFSDICILATGNKCKQVKNNKKYIIFIVDNISFEYIIFPCISKFIGTLFCLDTSFAYTKFCNDALFFNTTFSGYTSFSDATFYGKTDFSDATFSGEARFVQAFFSRNGKATFKGATFSGEAIFLGATFSDLTSFSSAIFSDESIFENTTFLNESFFQNTKFSSKASFKDATFIDSVNFSGTTFSGMATFKGATFSDEVDFRHTTFSVRAHFLDTTFSGCALFGFATFSGVGDFRGATFSDEASFRLSTFEKQVNFSAARFRKNTDFSAINSQKSFNLRDACFHVVPDFSEAAFHAPPALDEVKIEDQLPKRSGRFSFRSLPDVTPTKARDVSRRFRALGKMAHEARDWLNEMEFFAQEIRVRRFGLDFPLGEWRGLRKGLAWVARESRLKPVRQAALKFAQGIKAIPWCGPHVGRFWFGWFYEVLSDFGRSFARPVAWWVASLFGFALLYWWWAQWSASFRDVIAVSFRQGLVVSGLVRSGHYQHLLTEVFGSVPGKPNIPDLPHWLFFWMNVQTVVSAFFLFLFFLAVRNHFRIR